jgi:hypothetical protein
MSKCCGNNRNVTYMPEQVVMELDASIMPPVHTSTAYLINQ